MNNSPHPLDNPVWSALTTVHAAVAEGRGLARRYPEGMSPFGGMADLSREAFVDLRALVPDNGMVALETTGIPHVPPDDLFLVREVIPVLQLVQPTAPPVPPIDAEIVRLGLEHGEEMLALTQRAGLGPFGPRIVEVGTYLGVRDDSGELIALSGERYALPGYVELSAVCTDPAQRGRGLGSALVATLCREIHGRGAQPFLHVGPHNPALRMYQAMGFVHRADLQVVLLEPVIHNAHDTSP